MKDAMTPSAICPITIGRTDHLANVRLSIERAKKGSGGLILNRIGKVR